MCVTYIYHGGEGIHDVLLVQRGDGLGIVARDTVGDIGEQLSEIGDFEYFVQCEELQGGDTSVFKYRWESTVGEAALGFLFNYSELGRVGTGETIWEWEFEGSRGDIGSCGKEGKQG